MDFSLKKPFLTLSMTSALLSASVLRLKPSLCLSRFHGPPSRVLCSLSVATSPLEVTPGISELEKGESLGKGNGNGSAKVRVRVKGAKAKGEELKQGWVESLQSPLGGGGVGGDWVIGVDPDNSGALAVVKRSDCELGFEARVFDSPVVPVLVGKRIRRRLDPRSIVQLLQSLDAPLGTKAYIEQSAPFPHDGKQGWWSGGFGYGLWIGILVASGFSVVPVPSLVWKNLFELSGNGPSKDDSRRVASDLFPSLSDQLKRKKDHGRAEALLIAAYGKGMKLNSPCHVGEYIYGVLQEPNCTAFVSENWVVGIVLLLGLETRDPVFRDVELGGAELWCSALLSICVMV
ncbi:hypothetical protein MLD38_011746 [Melastoma candidum]|uniref:Uncharacterized protein n=1 Tax=Melastoma candidum TaxID=119954 RepID=A0ACB9R4L8_9MYRT|nr:hypothetical protein MLD38_011746 [Melastoma candidum]